MKFVFLTCRLVMGGNETLMIRMARWLISRGHSVAIITAQGGYLEGKMPEDCETFIVGSTNFGAAVVPRWPFPRRVRERIRDADFVMSFSGGGCMFAYHLIRATRSRAKLIAGVFHPNTGTTIGRKHFFDFVFQEGTHDENKLYMNEAMRQIHEHRMDRPLPTSPIWKLPVEVCDSENVFPNRQSGIILSVGRLTQFKGYNLYMPRVLRQLLNEGYDTQWHVIGDDEPNTRELVKEEMIAECKRLGVLDRCTMHGIVPYEELRQHFAKSTVFVGMGTAMLEASACGVPSVCAVVDDMDGLSYGYLWNQPPGCVGERLTSREPNKKVVNLLRNVLNADERSYLEFTEKARASVRQFELEDRMNEFFSICAAAKEGTKPISQSRTLYIANKGQQWIRKRIVSQTQWWKRRLLKSTIENDSKSVMNK
ncbi:Glycosyl transferases group 1 [Planctomycetes bacterium CA13]|uniref:Glycosyl transferases group 1 n=1 Tax=Novipirellula herctigrandis TaxID=2527986 RepID=A0A5C5YZY1_9BACT|nr:Glycosyl transferases group 1 [Planctomycetes bacterium CA13]